MKTTASLSIAAALMTAGMAFAGNSTPAIFGCTSDNGFFVPFSSSSSSALRYGDSGWISDFGTDQYAINRIRLGFAIFGSTSVGTTNINFTLNDGDPSGLVYGSGAALWSTTVTGVELANTGAGNVQYFELSIDIPDIQTLGGYNTIGWSIGVDQFASDGLFGFQCSSTLAQYAGFYTSNASFTNDGQNWGLFSFGGDPTFGVANFTASIYGEVVPAPGVLALLGAAGLAGARRRRS